MNALLREAAHALGRNKLRSGLTVLGVTIGIGAVICVVALGTAGSAQIQEQLRNMGDNAIWVEAGGRARNGIRLGGHQTPTLTLADAQAIGQLRLIKSVTPHVNSRVQVVYQNQNWNTMYRGVSPEYFSIRRWDVVQGLAFTRQDCDNAADVAVIGQTVREQLFGNDDDPIGKVMRITNIPFRVIGLLRPKGQSAFGQDQDDLVLIPYTTAMSKIAGKTWLDDILCSAVSSDALPAATGQVVDLLRDRHRIRVGMDDDFNIRTPEDVIEAQLQASNIFTLLLAGIASVSLLVGGIGIMNVMLVSVTERTREIGIRLAIGASEGYIQVQFLAEAVILSLFGGAVGVVAGVLGSAVLGRLLNWPMSISAKAILLAAAFAIGVGITFGFYPAQKASKLDPIEALRYE